jgi:uridine kinase
MNNYKKDYTLYNTQLSWLNHMAKQKPDVLIQSTEKSYRESLSKLADSILNRQHRCKVIMLSGPSSSGKTTTARMLRQEFLNRGAGTVVISLDDFYLGEGRAPLLPNGEHDYEAVEALNVAAVKQCLRSLLQDGMCDIPQFDFQNRRPHDYTVHIALGPNDIAIIEGIHALHPIFTDHIPAEGLVKLYISVKQGIYEDEKLILSAKDLRFLRRLVRDYLHRAASPQLTAGMWQAVCRGEDLYIRPFRKTSDYVINSIHVYEPCVLGPVAIPLLKQIPFDDPFYAHGAQFIDVLSRFYPLEATQVPADSLIREFLGGGIY